MPTFSYGYSYSYYDDLYSTYLIVYAIIGLIGAIVFGCITKKINENKGYDGGFAWGFWLGVIGIIVVSCRAPAEDEFEYSNNPMPRQRNTQSAAPGTWYCTGCGRQHAAYETSCICGQPKRVSRPTLNTAARPTNASAAPSAQPKYPAPGAGRTQAPTYSPAPAAPKLAPKMNEADTIRTLKEYKELMDSGAITHEEFEQKKRELLGQ